MIDYTLRINLQPISKTFWLDIASHVTHFHQSEAIISEWRSSNTTLKFIYEIAT